MATITKTKDAEPLGTYTPTSLDARKAAADVLLTAVEGGGRYSVSSKVALSGNGVKSYGNGNYSVTEAALGRIRKDFVVECDF